MTVFADVRSDLVDKLAAAGLPATDDPAALPPYVLVAPFRSDGSGSTRGGWPSVVDVQLVAPPPGDRTARDALEGFLETTLVTVTAYRDYYPTTVLTGAGKELPAYVVTVSVDVPNPTC